MFELSNGEILVVGCDSAGGIGPKPLDKIKVDGYTLGKFTARVALMEVLSTGAKPICVVDTLSVEPEPLGSEILNGVRDEAESAGLDPKLAVTGSCEKNFAVQQTGIGITVIGISKKSSMRIGISQPNDAIVALGVPCVGNEVVPAEKKGVICTITDAVKLLSLKFIHEIIPVGSEGIAREVGVLAESSGLKFEFADSLPFSVNKSAGPATVLLASVPRSKISLLPQYFSKPIAIVAELF